MPELPTSAIVSALVTACVVGGPLGIAWVQARRGRTAALAALRDAIEVRRSATEVGSRVRPTSRKSHLIVPAPDGPTLIAVPGLPPASPKDHDGADVLARRFASIWGLADSGAGPEAIARREGLPIGQVELILGLRREASRRAGVSNPR